MQRANINSNIISILFLTPLRAAIILFAPLLILFSKAFFNSAKNKKIHILYFIILLSSVIGLLKKNIDIANILIYIWICFPILYLLFCNTRKGKQIIPWDVFFKSLRWWLIIIDVCGFICRFIIFRTVDDFGYAYGTHFKGVSGLSVINAFVMLYYVSHLLKGNYSKAYICNFLFFFCSFIFCYSGLTLATFIAALFVYSILNVKLKNWWKIISLFVIGIALISYSAKDILTYNTRNIELFLDKDASQDNARKRVMYLRFVELFQSDYSIALIGVGPGGYNSRVCFLTNNDADNIFTTILGHHMPEYHQKDIFPLWNKSFVDFDAYNDGARNKPFSSLVAFGAEIGIVFLLLFTYFWFKRISLFRKRSKTDVEYLYLYLLNVFTYLLLITEYWFESSEFVLFLIIQNVLITDKINHDTQNNSLLLAKRRPNTRQIHVIHQ